MTQQKSLLHQKKVAVQNQSHEQNVKRNATKIIPFQLKKKPKNKTQNNWVQEMMRAAIVSDAAALVHRRVSYCFPPIFLYPPHT